MVGRALNNCVGMCCACETGAHTIYWMFGMRCPPVCPLRRQQWCAGPWVAACGEYCCGCQLGVCSCVGSQWMNGQAHRLL